MTDWKARPTTYNGIAMRSRLEASFAARLDELGLQWEYEPRAYANQSGQYLPDFLITADRDGRYVRTFVEVKPTRQAAWIATKRMEVIWDSEPKSELTAAFRIDEQWHVISASAKTHDWSEITVDCQNCIDLALEREELLQRISDLIDDRHDLRARLEAVESYSGNGRMERVGEILKTIGVST